MTEDQKKVFKRIVENGRIRVDAMDALLILISEVERDASAPLERLKTLLDAQTYENDVLSVGQIRRALSFSGEQEPPRCNHWPTQKRCGVCGMDNTSTPSRPEPQEAPIPPDTEAELLHSIKLLMDQCEQLRGEYQRGLDDAIRAIRAGRDDWSSGEDIGKITNALLGVAEGRIADLSRASSSLASDK